jgi:hypothetical protein
MGSIILLEWGKDIEYMKPSGKMAKRVSSNLNFDILLPLAKRQQNEKSISR